jgi:hypothetical protein
MSLDARSLRAKRKSRIAARVATAEGEDMPDWLENKIEEESEPGTDVGEPGLDAEEEAESMLAEGEEDAEDITEDIEDMEDAEEELDENIEEMEEGVQELAEDLEELKEDEEEQDELEEGSAALGAFRYDPVHQKPMTLGNRTRNTGYHYFGPPPDAGTSYGYYTDASGLQLIAPLQKQVFSPVSGKAMRYEGRVDIDGLASVLAMADQMVRIPGAKGELMTSAPLKAHAMKRIFDPMNGSDISDAVATICAEQEADELLREVDEDEDMAAMEEIENPADLGEGWESDDDDFDAEAEEMLLESVDEDEEDDVNYDAEAEQLMQSVGEDMEDEVEDMDEEMGEDMDEEMGEEMEDEGEEMEEEEEEAEAVKYEAIQELDEIEEDGLTEADVHMTLFDEVDHAGHVKANPYWNIDVKGQPVARVYLQDQPKPEEIREVFCSADYHRGVAGAVEKVGLKPVLTQIKAHLWANKVHEATFAQKLKREAEAVASSKVTATTENLLKNLLRRVAVVCAGMDKNFYREVGNPLKEALWSEFHRFGIHNPSPIIEAAFRKGSTPYFEAVLNKAVEYMEMSPNALAEIQKAIGDADVLAPGDTTQGDQLPDATPEEMPTLSERLAASSVALGGIPAITGDAVGDHKRALRQELSLGGAGPRFRNR